MFLLLVSVIFNFLTNRIRVPYLELSRTESLFIVELKNVQLLIYCKYLVENKKKCNNDILLLAFLRMSVLGLAVDSVKERFYRQLVPIESSVAKNKFGRAKKKKSGPVKKKLDGRKKDHSVIGRKNRSCNIRLILKPLLAFFLFFSFVSLF